MALQPSTARELVRGTVPKIIELSETVIYGDIWERPGLSKRDRSLITACRALWTASNNGISELSADGRNGSPLTYRPEQIRSHLIRALDNGVTKEEVGEIITHLAFYSGWPTSMTAARIATEVIEERG